MNDTYIAHFYKKEDNTFQIQSVSEHNKNVAVLAMCNSPDPDLSAIVWLCGILHDAGKYRDGFQNYIKRAMNDESVRRGEENHSTAGGFLISQIAPGTNLALIIQLAVFFHHGLEDSFSWEKGTLTIEERLRKKENYKNVDERYYQFIDTKRLEEKCCEARKDLAGLLENIKKFVRLNNGKKDLYGNRDFFLGLYERTILSLLIDADRTDTACFMQQKELPAVKTEEEIQDIWDKSILFLEDYINNLKTTSRLDEYRREISQMCMEAGLNEKTLYRLTVPTGAGKTLSSLRFALHHAKKFHKRHIIYVAPFQSIIDQNADEIRNAIGNPGIVLEHHCNVIHETEEERKLYDMLTENWDVPIIVTTAVQFLNTLFASGNGNIRRMYSILNSVIIFDEVQALPVKITKMYNLAVNFLTAFGKSTVVLCSATQPLFEQLDENKLLPPANMAGEHRRYAQAFKRTEIIDATEQLGSELSVETLQDFIWDKMKKSQQILVIVNTKRCAEKVYKGLKESCEGEDCLLFHLSTNMCAANRREVLKEIEKNLAAKKRLICISTQLVEAGVNLSFQCVIRSLAGLDSIIQAAGRCNRHGEWDTGDVFIVQMNKEAENVDSLTDIRIAQECMRQVLRQFKMQPQAFDHRLDSEQAINYYYQMYLGSQKSQMEYIVLAKGVSVTLLDLLSGNKKMWKDIPQEVKDRNKNILLKQAFKTAGDLFEVIPEDGKTDVVVEYNEKALTLTDRLSKGYLSISEEKQILRELQIYTVGISEQLRHRLDSAITPICEGSVLVLSGNYYSRETGVSEEPLGMDLLNY